MSADRLFQIVYLLLEQERMTAEALAAQLGVSVRTVYRDVDALSAAGVPVCTTQGIGGSVALMETFEHEIVSCRILRQEDLEEMV